MFSTEHHKPGNPITADDVYVIRIRMADGAITHPAYIPFSESAHGEAVAEAAAYYSRVLGARGVVKEVVLESSLNHAGVRDPSAIVKWGDLKDRLNREFLEHLERKNVLPSTLADISASLRVEANRQQFIDSVNSSQFTQSEKNDILRALAIATKAHRGVTAARPQDTTGLFHVPYINHCICIASNALRLGLSAHAVQAALLHDVVEDTSWTLARLGSHFSEPVVRMVEALTRKEGQSIQDFLAHVANLTGEARVIKALDRLDNLIRSFSIEDRSYIGRIVKEDRGVYHRFFREVPTLSDLAESYFRLHDEIASVWDLLP